MSRSKGSPRCTMISGHPSGTMRSGMPLHRFAETAQTHSTKGKSDATAAFSTYFTALEITQHEAADPLGYHWVIDAVEVGEIRFDVENRRAVDGIEALDLER